MRSVRVRNQLTVLLTALAVGLLGCAADSGKTAPIGEAFVGPYELEIIEELSPDARTVATLAHGERVAITGRLRKFVHVRAESGIEGWVDGRMLLAPEHMARLRDRDRKAAALPSQGEATVYDVLNLHTEPNRGAPSFHQLRNGVMVDVVAHRVAPRAPYAPPEPDEPTEYPLNAYGPPPGDASQEVSGDGWTLVRLRDGRTGWALSQMLRLAIPDEVAQYAEGQRITSYFSLGTVNDGGETKHHWLWTTVSKQSVPYQFDSFRVFVWSTRHHRYETAYIERNLTGHYPVSVEMPEDAAGRRWPLSRFSLIVAGEHGLERRTYAFQGYRVRLLETAPWDPPRELILPPGSSFGRDEGDAPSLIERMRRAAADWFGGEGP